MGGTKQFEYIIALFREYLSILVVQIRVLLLTEPERKIYTPLRLFYSHLQDTFNESKTFSAHLSNRLFNIDIIYWESPKCMIRKKNPNFQMINSYEDSVTFTRIVICTILRFLPQRRQEPYSSTKMQDNCICYWYSFSRRLCISFGPYLGYFFLMFQ